MKELETSGKLTHEETLTGMVNALAERNAELEKFILDLYSDIPTPPKRICEILLKN